MAKTIIKSPEELGQWLDKSLFSGKEIALDTETTSLRWYELKVLGISLCRGDNMCYIPNPTKETCKILSRYLTPLVTVIMHNAPFDIAVLSKLNFKFYGPIFCTQTAAFLLDENKESYKLKDLAEEILKAKNVVRFEDIKDLDSASQKFQDYAMMDAKYTWDLYQGFKSKIKDKGLTHLFQDIEMPFQHVLADLTINGILVNKKRATELYQETLPKLLNKHITALKSVNKPYGIISQNGVLDVYSLFNINSPKQLISLVTNELGLELTEKTKGGAFSMGHAVLKTFKDKHPFISTLLEYREYEKLITAFLNPLFEHIDTDGRVRPSFHNTVAKTGRLSCSNPNVQQLPKRGENDINYRECFIAPEGKIIIVADFSGQELRALAEVTKDKGLIDAFNANQDLHLAVANRVFNLGISESSLVEGSSTYAETRRQFDNERYRAKNGVLFPLIYGSTAWGISRGIGISIEEAQGLIDKFYQMYPAVKHTKERVHKYIRDNHRINNKTGRIRRFPNRFITQKNERQAFNFLIQGLCADAMKASANAVRKMFSVYPEAEAKLLMLVHDEIVIECDKTCAVEVIEGMKMVMEGAYSICVRLPVEISKGINYGQAK